MKTNMARKIAAVLVVLFTSVAVPQSTAAPRDGREKEWSGVFAKMVAKFQKAFGITTNEDFPGPPKP